VVGGWGLHNEELHNIHASPNIRAIKSKRARWAEHVSRSSEMRNTYRVLVREPEGKSPFGRSGR